MANKFLNFIIKNKKNDYYFYKIIIIKIMTTRQYKGASKIIINNDDCIILEKNSTWYRFPFYAEKTESDECDFEVMIESKDDVDYYVHMFIIKNNDDYNSDNYLKIPLTTLQKLDPNNYNRYIYNNLISISDCAIIREFVRNHM